MKKLLPTSTVLLIMIAAFFSVAAQRYSNRTIVEPELWENPIAIQDPNAPAMISLAALYAPMENHDHWIRMVCAGMTSSGCDYFKSHQANGMWESQADHNASSGGYIESVKDGFHRIGTHNPKVGGSSPPPLL